MLHVHCLFKYLFVGCVCARCSPFKQQRIKTTTTDKKSTAWFWIQRLFWFLADGCLDGIDIGCWLDRYLCFCVYRKWWLRKQWQGVGDANSIFHPLKFHQQSNKFTRREKKLFIDVNYDYDFSSLVTWVAAGCNFSCLFFISRSHCLRQSQRNNKTITIKVGRNHNNNYIYCLWFVMYMRHKKPPLHSQCRKIALGNVCETFE